MYFVENCSILESVHRPSCGMTDLGMKMTGQIRDNIQVSISLPIFSHTFNLYEEINSFLRKKKRFSSECKRKLYDFSIMKWLLLAIQSG